MITLPRKVTTWLLNQDFGRQVFQFASDTFDALRALRKEQAIQDANIAALQEEVTAGGGVPGAHASTHLPVSGSDPLTVGTTADSFCVGNDARLSDDRTASGLRTATTVVDIDGATAPTSGQVLTATGGSAATWQDPAGGSVASELFTAPASPHASLDDEFLGTSLDAKWSVRNSAGTVVTPGATVDPYTTFASGDPKIQVGRTYWDSWCQVQVEANNTTWTMTQPYSVPTNMFIWCRVAVHRAGTVNNNQGYVELGFWADNGSGGPAHSTNGVQLAYDANAASPALLFYTYTAGVSATVRRGSDMGMAAGTVYEYFGIHKLNTTYHGWVFAHGRGLAYMGSATHATAMAHVGFRFIDSTSVSPANSLINIDFFRAVDNVTAYLP